MEAVFLTHAYGGFLLMKCRTWCWEALSAGNVLVRISRFDL